MPYEDWEPWVRRVGIAAFVVLLVVFVVLVGGYIVQTMSQVFGAYRAAEESSSTAAAHMENHADGP